MIRCFLILIAVQIIFKLDAQDISQINHFSLADGLDSREITNIVRDEYGLFWLFNEYYIQTFDGVDFKTIEIDNAINFSNYQDVFYKKNKIYLIGINRDNYLEINLKDYVYVESIIKIQTDSTIFRFIDNEVCSLTKSSKEAKLTIGNNSIEIETSDEISVQDFYSLNNKIWIIDQIGDLWYKGELGYDFQKVDSISNLKSFVGNYDNSIWLLTKKGTISTLDKRPLNYLVNKNIESAKIFKDTYGNGVLMLGDRWNKFYHMYFSKGGEQFVDYSKIINIKKNITSIFSEDYSKKLFGCTYNGLYLVHFNTVFDNHFVKPEIKKDDFGNTILGLVYSKVDSTIFFTEEVDGLFKLKNGHVTHILPNEAYPNAFQGNNNMVLDSIRGKLINIRYISGSFYLEKYEVKSGHYSIIPIKIYPRSLKIIEDQLFVFGRNNNNQTGLIHIYNLNDFSLIKEMVMDSQVNNIEKEDDYFWIAQSNGLFKIPSSQLGTQKPKLVYSSRVKNILLLPNKILVGTYGHGVVVLDRAGNKIKQIDKKNSGISNDIIEFMIEEEQNDIVVGTRAGLVLLNKNLEVVQNYLSKEGISNKEFNRNCVLKDHSGKVYTGTINGICSFFTDEIAKNTSRTISLRSKNVGFFKNGKFIESQVVDYNCDYIDVIYAVSDYIISSQDPQWNYVFNIESDLGHDKFEMGKEVFRLQKPDPGERTLRIFKKDYNKKNVLVENFVLKVNNIYYQYFSQILILVLAFLSVYLLFKNKLDDFNHKQKLKESELKNQIETMKSLALRSQMNPHFLFNCLGSIQFLIQSEQIDLADNYLSSFGRLMRLFLESSRKEVVNLTEELGMLSFYIELEHLRFDHRFEYSIDTDPRIDKTVLLPPMIIQPFIENAILHGLVPSKDRMGSLHLYFEHVHKNSFKCIVSNTGISRDFSNQHNISDKKVSRATQIVDNRIALFNEVYGSKIKYKINDLKDSFDLGIGTQVVITFENIPNFTSSEVNFNQHSNQDSEFLDPLSVN